MNINPKNWSGRQVLVVATIAVLALFFAVAIIVAAEITNATIVWALWFLLSGFLVWWSWMQPQLRDWSIRKLLFPGILILIFALLGSFLFLPVTGVVFALFFAVPYAVLIFSWRKLAMDKG